MDRALYSGDGPSYLVPGEVQSALGPNFTHMYSTTLTLSVHLQGLQILCIHGLELDNEMVEFEKKS